MAKFNFLFTGDISSIFIVGEAFKQLSLKTSPLKVFF